MSRTSTTNLDYSDFVDLVEYVEDHMRNLKRSIGGDDWRKRSISSIRAAQRRLSQLEKALRA